MKILLEKRIGNVGGHIFLNVSGQQCVKITAQMDLGNLNKNGILRL